MDLGGYITIRYVTAVATLLLVLAATALGCGDTTHSPGTPGSSSSGWLALSDGTTADRYALVRIGSDWVIVSTAGEMSLNCALKKDGSLWAWRYRGDFGGATGTPVRLGSEAGFVTVAAGVGDCVAPKDDGSLWTWGGSSWEVDPAPPGPRFLDTPALVESDSGWTMIAACDEQSIALKADGSFWDLPVPEGQAVSTTPRLITKGLSGSGGDPEPTSTTVAPAGPIYKDTIRAVAAGSKGAVVVKTNGSIWTWERALVRLRARPASPPWSAPTLTG